MEANLIAEYKSRTVQPTLAEVMADLDHNSNDRHLDLRTYLTKQGVCTSREFDSSRRHAYLTAMLGSVPTTAAELIDIVVEHYSVRSGNQSVQGLTWACLMTATRQPCDEMMLVREAHRINDTLLGNAFRDANITRAVNYWIDTHRKLERQQCFTSLCEPGSFDWEEFGATFFDGSHTGPAVQAAALQKFIWQVKRRLAGLPVTNHLMVVVYGGQGVGKSQAVERIIAPLGDLATTGDFNRLGDSREVGLFGAYAVFLDEMQKATHADVDRVKNVITRDHFGYRPMGSNSDVSVRQNSTFIGTSNKSLQQMIHDPTGNRRFFQIDWRKDAGPTEWAIFNALDIEAMWRSVDHLADDPTAVHMEAIRAMQASARVQSSVGQFFDAVTEGQGCCTVMDSGNPTERLFTSTMRKEELFRNYRGYCDYMRVKHPVEFQMFLAEARRIADQETACAFIPKKTNAFNGWAYVGPTGQDTGTITPILAAVGRRVGK